MDKVIGTGQKLYKSVFSKLCNGYCTTEGMRGPVVKDVAPRFLRWGLQKISLGDQFFRTFSISNPNIASAAERWYGTHIASRALLGNASPRHRCIVDMTRNNDGGLFRAIFDRFCILRKTLSIAKDGSSVSTVYSRGNSQHIPFISKKVVIGTDGTKLREVYRASDMHNPRITYTFVIDAKNGSKATWQTCNDVFVKECTGFKSYTRNAMGDKGTWKLTTTPVDLKDSIRRDENNLKQGWQKFLTSKFEELKEQ